MGKSIFQEELIKIQFEYKALLEKGLTEWNEEYFIEFIEEVNIFWKQNEPALRSIYKHELPRLDTVFLTAVTKIDLQYLQHYSMKLTGSICLIDDPLSSYLNLLDKEIPNFMKEKLSKVAQANIRESITLIGNYSNDFIVLPLREVIPNDIVAKAAEQFYISLFNNIDDMDEYFKKIKSFDEIEVNLRPDVKDWILFGWDDSQSGSMKERFRNFVETEYLDNEKGSDGEKFFFSQFGYISQSLHILFTMVELEFVPYIRGSVPFRYFSILYTSLKDNLSLNLDNQIIRTTISYIFEEIFDYKQILGINYEEYLNRISELNLYNYVEDSLQLKNKELHEISFKRIKISVEDFYENEFRRTLNF